MSEKSSSATSVEKGLYLYDLLLFSGKKYTVNDLTAMLQCSKSTVSRLLQQIENRKNLELHRDIHDGREWYSLSAPARRPRIICSQQEFDEMANCLALAAPSLSEEQQQTVSTLIGKLRLLFVGQNNVISSAVEPPVKSWIDYQGREEMLATLLQAIREQRLCTVTYQRGKKTPLSWSVAPVRLFCSADTLYLGGWLIPANLQDDEVTPESFGGEDSETLKPCFVCLHRIKDVTLTERHHTLPMTQEIPKFFGVMSGTPFTVKAHFDAAVADYVQDRQYSVDQKVVSYSDGSVDLEFSARNCDEVVAWLLSFGSSAKLLEPTAVLARLKEELAAILARYGGVVVYPQISPEEAAQVVQ